MKRLCTVILLNFFCVCYPIHAFSASLSAPVYLNTVSGWNLLMHSANQNAKFGNLVRYFQTQDNLAYCGVASSAIVLNALGVKAPADSWHYPYSYFNQRNVFSPALLRLGITPHKISSHGMTLATLTTILSSYGLKTHLYYASDLSLQNTSRIMLRAMNASGEFVLVNFSRAVLHQKGGGHISPLAAYNAPHQAVLILDVASYKYPASWSSFQLLYQAMRSIDKDSGKSRGFVVVSRP